MDFASERARMVERQIAGRGITDPAILAAFRAVPREAFVPDELTHLAYEDGPLPIGEGQTISQPYIVALMIEAAGVRAGQRVLEIGAGSGYAAAVIGQIAAEVIAIERHADLAAGAADRLQRLGYANVEIVHGDGSGGLPARAPFDAIVAAASGRDVPQVLIEQLAAGGRLVMPVGEQGGEQELLCVTRLDEDRFERRSLGAVRFVPLIGREGWHSGA